MRIEIRYHSDGDEKWVTIRAVGKRTSKERVYKAVSGAAKRLFPTRTTVVDPDDREPGLPKTRITIK